MGYVSWIGKYDTGESFLVTLLRKAGAVFYVKTSVPQSLMVCETINNIIGRTVNPRNKNWSCGGSSGGEGANVGLRGGIIGVGTDIGTSSVTILSTLLTSLGGSIRVPAAFNFLYGLRPSHGRLPYAKMANSMEGQETVHSVCGPLTHSVAGELYSLSTDIADSLGRYETLHHVRLARGALEVRLKGDPNALAANRGRCHPVQTGIGWPDTWLLQLRWQRRRNFTSGHPTRSDASRSFRIHRSFVASTQSSRL